MPQTVTIVIIVLLVILIGFGAYAFAIAKKPVEKQTSTVTEKLAGAGKVEMGERIASPTAEHIEEIAREKIGDYLSENNIILDFGSTETGLAIWVNQTQYDDVKDIPDERIRQAIQEAIAEFNA